MAEKLILVPLTLSAAVEVVRAVRSMSINRGSSIAQLAREVDAELMRSTGKNADQLIFEKTRERK